MSSPYWNNGAGAVTWINGTTGLIGTISTANSLTGSAGDAVGYASAVALPNGNYLARSPRWNFSRGAVTWGNGTTGLTGTISVSNSLVGGNASDNVGMIDDRERNLGVTVLSNGNYVVSSPYWQRTIGEYNVGAVTWGNGATGVTGEVSAANSLIGSSPNDKIGLLREGDPIAGITNSPYAAKRTGCKSRNAAKAVCKARTYSLDLSAKWLSLVDPFNSSSLM